MHDGTVHGSTVRICQKENAYVQMIKQLIEGAGGRAWTYREGRRRDLFVVEFSRSFLRSYRLRSRGDAVSYARGFFDAEGGVPASTRAYPYIYFAQKGRLELEELREILECLGIACGRIHLPSARADPDYWRFYVSHRSHERFARIIGSWHARKAPILGAMAGRKSNQVRARPTRAERP